MNKNSRNLQLSLIGVRTNSSGTENGVANAPVALRNAGLVKTIRCFHEVHDEGDIIPIKPIKKRDTRSGIIAYSSLVSMIRDVSTSVNHALLENRFPLVIGGDCPVLLGCLAAAVKVHHHNIGLFFIDGHEDAYPPHLSPTGEAADMELGFALGLNVPHRIRDVIGSVPLIQYSKVCLFGTRDSKDLKNLNVPSLVGKIQSYDDTIIRKSNITTLTSKALKRLGSDCNSIWLHIDLDVLSTRSFSAQDYPQSGGLNWIQLEKLCKSILSSCNVVGCDVTIYNPDLDPNNRFGKRIVDFLATILS